MQMSKWLLWTIAALAVVGPVSAGQFNDILNMGDAAPAWVDLPGVDGKKHSLADLKSKQVVVVVFTCNSCPVAEQYEDRLIAFAKKHAGPDSPVAVVAINVNRIAEDKLDKMKERAEGKKFNFAYLYDESQKIGKAYGAQYTPEFFVLDKDRKIVYMGAMDDASPPAEARKFFLEDAVAAALKGAKPATAETLARGCKVRYVRSR
jgi:peroxiredoxin